MRLWVWQLYHAAAELSRCGRRRGVQAACRRDCTAVRCVRRTGMVARSTPLHTCSPAVASAASSCSSPLLCVGGMLALPAVMLLPGASISSHRHRQPRGAIVVAVAVRRGSGASSVTRILVVDFAVHVFVILVHFCSTALRHGLRSVQPGWVPRCRACARCPGKLTCIVIVSVPGFALSSTTFMWLTWFVVKQDCASSMAKSLCRSCIVSETMSVSEDTTMALHWRLRRSRCP
jgi:hypothetical protein